MCNPKHLLAIFVYVLRGGVESRVEVKLVLLELLISKIVSHSTKWFFYKVKMALLLEGGMKWWETVFKISQPWDLRLNHFGSQWGMLFSLEFLSFLNIGGITDMHKASAKVVAMQRYFLFFSFLIC